MLAEVFVYTGPGGVDVPQDVVRVRIDSSVTSIPYEAFRHDRLRSPNYSNLQSWVTSSSPPYAVEYDACSNKHKVDS